MSRHCPGGVRNNLRVTGMEDGAGKYEERYMYSLVRETVWLAAFLSETRSTELEYPMLLFSFCNYRIGLL